MSPWISPHKMASSMGGETRAGWSGSQESAGGLVPVMVTTPPVATARATISADAGGMATGPVVRPESVSVVAAATAIPVTA